MARKTALPKITEAEFQAQVLDVAHLYGWHVAHFRASRTKYGWRTAVSADGKGFPDLVMVRERVVWAELKRKGGTLTQDQQAWRDVLEAARQEWYCWCPSDFDEMQETLKRREEVRT